MILYLDTSSLVKLYVEETYSNLVREWTREAGATATSRVAYAEASSAFARRRIEGSLGDEQFGMVLETLAIDWARLVLLPVREKKAGALAVKHLLRGFDAIHLAAASDLPSIFQGEPVLSLPSTSGSWVPPAPKASTLSTCPRGMDWSWSPTPNTGEPAVLGAWDKLAPPMTTPDDRLRERIRSGGPIPFSVFMEDALYGEGGYYRREDLPIGEAGDFVTGSSFSPLFGRTTSRLLQRLDRVLGRPADLFEAGYGTGVHLGNVISGLAGGERRIVAWDRVARSVPPGAERIDRLEEVAPVEGLIFSYELFDALPVHRLIGRDGGVGELWVNLDTEGSFTWSEGELSESGLRDLLGEVVLQPGQIADLAPGWFPLYAELAGRLERGLLVTCDYGFERSRLLDPRIREHGTLACYSRQRVHRNPFVLVGEQDLTAHVDFTSLIQAGEKAGLTTVILTRQAIWLTACGLFEDLQGAGPEARQEAMALLDGEGMGEDIRVLVQARGIEVGEVLDLRMLGKR